MHKKWWLLPIIIVLFLLSALLVFAQGYALAPFITSTRSSEQQAQF